MKINSFFRFLTPLVFCLLVFSVVLPAQEDNKSDEKKANAMMGGDTTNSYGRQQNSRPDSNSVNNNSLNNNSVNRSQEEKESIITGVQYDKSAIAGNLSSELVDKLKLSENQGDRIKEILVSFQDNIIASNSPESKNGNYNIPASDKTNTAKPDKTGVKENNGNDDKSAVTGRPKTKNQSSNENMTGSSNRMTVGFERARIDADSRIEELLTPEQAVEYGKIKSDWWDKIREKVQTQHRVIPGDNKGDNKSREPDQNKK